LKGKILLVDDEETVLSITGLMLEELHLEIITAADGIEAVEKFQSNSSEISLVILDMVMPRMRGEEVFVKIKEINPNVPIIVSSGFTREETMNRLSEVEVEGFMQKPFRRIELINEIARVMERKN